MDRLIIGKEYHCYLEGRYLGIATFSNDTNIGESFINMGVTDKGQIIKHVFQPDKTELVINN